MLAKSWKKAKSSERKMELEAVCKAIEFWENYKTQTENVVVLDRIEKIEYKCLLKKEKRHLCNLYVLIICIR